MKFLNLRVGELNLPLLGTAKQFCEGVVPAVFEVPVAPRPFSLLFASLDCFRYYSG